MTIAHQNQMIICSRFFTKFDFTEMTKMLLVGYLKTLS